MKNQKRLLYAALTFAFLLSAGPFCSARAEEMTHEHGSDASMQMHHLHVLMNHGLEMVVEGSNMVMLADMKMAPSMDPMTAEHGRAMIKSGREVIEHALKGPEMQAMHKAGHGDAPLMKYTHELGEAELSVVNMLEKMGMEGPMSDDMMAMHHMHIMMNHALEMAAQGSNMVMLGQMGMAGDIDKYSIDHGKMMLSDAKAMVNEVMGGKSMTDMHQKGVTGGNATMAETHKIGDAAKKVVDLLDTMASAGAMKMK
ncbi:MAG TPA: hypothetical protein VEM40_11110 [Nitrospirota bacterium]|nr:hypothetical protein [Nitrospirota bacterium]